MSNRFSVRKLALPAVLALVTAAAHAAPEKTFSPYWAWDNVFTGTINWTPGTGSDPTWTATYNLGSGNLYGYPASVRGYHYGYNPSGDKLFPKQLEETTSIPAAFSYTSYGTKMTGDFTYDMFLRWDTNVGSGTSNPELEVMVWGINASYPISTTGSPIVTSAITENGVVYDLYEGYNSAAGYSTYSFVPHRTSVPSSIPNGNGSINVDLKNFFNVLENLPNSLYNNWMYLDVVEAGIEITGGDGEALCTYFSVDAY
jgi:hypothetical protein